MIKFEWIEKGVKKYVFRCLMSLLHFQKSIWREESLLRAISVSKRNNNYFIMWYINGNLLIDVKCLSLSFPGVLFDKFEEN